MTDHNAPPPEPLTPLDCDLRDFSFMPLEIARLRRSKTWIVAKRNPAIAFYLINLWAAAWHSLPAGSLEDDDDMLADAAMCTSVEHWMEVRAEALRGWIKCSDGRLYHPVVAEKVNSSWKSKKEQRARTAAARAARAENRRRDCDIDVASSVTDNATEDATVSKEKEKERLYSSFGTLSSAPPAADVRAVDLLGAAPAVSVEVRRAKPVFSPEMLDEAAVIWNELAVTAGLPQVSELTSKRRSALRRVLHDKLSGDLERWRAYIMAITASAFLTGHGPRGWRADFDWALKADNLVAVREGKYSREAA